MKQYVKSIDSLRILCILAVLLIHTSTRTLETAKFDLTGFPLTIFLNQIARFAVPLFFIISGFVLETNFDQSSGYISFLKKRFSKIINRGGISRECTHKIFCIKTINCLWRIPFSAMI